MSTTTVTLLIPPDLIEQLDAIAETRGASRAQVIEMACREFVRQLGHINSGAVERPSPHAVDVSPIAAALWEASWIDAPIEPEAAE